jgi:hypothetical protein
LSGEPGGTEGGNLHPPEGVYVYALQSPLGLSFEWASFCDRGFVDTEIEGDFRVYADCRVINLPRTFKWLEDRDNRPYIV